MAASSWSDRVGAAIILFILPVKRFYSSQLEELIGMSRLIRTTETLIDYVGCVGAREHPALRRCREETAQLTNANMQIAPEQGAFLGLLAKIVGAQQTLEIGTFTGYSALSVALVLPEGGRVVAL